LSLAMKSSRPRTRCAASASATSSSGPSQSSKDGDQARRQPTTEIHQPPLSLSFSDSDTKDAPFKHTPRASPRALSYFPKAPKNCFYHA
jgi:hypothetical protein